MQASVKLVPVLVLAAWAALAHAQDRLTTPNTGIRLEMEQTRARQTPKTDFGSVIKQGISTTADQNLSAGSVAAPAIPGGAVVGAAINGTGAAKGEAGATAPADSTGASTPLSLSPPPPPAGPVPIPYPNAAAREPGSLEIPNIKAQPPIARTPVPLPDPVLRPVEPPRAGPAPSYVLTPAWPSKIDAITIKQK